ncbi:MAG: hypothetical protein JW769_00275 [Parachlamydiales bacterium]|nr:hypothetical protein [Parachlamydiales bacterium]
MEDKKYQDYLLNLIPMLKKQAYEAKTEANSPKEGFEAYNKGELLAYHRVFSTMQKQASFFDLNQEEIRLSNINPDRDLVCNFP